MAYDEELADRIRELLSGERGITDRRMAVAVSGQAGRETRGWVRVAADGVKSKRQLQQWVTRGVDYAMSLEPK